MCTVAIEGEDYIILNSGISFGIGINRRCFSVAVTQDAIVELIEEFVIHLSGFPAELPPLLTVSNEAQVIIIDDESEC